ncbi:hypothetical protein G1H11_10420 [Phytoactinopolyspora alkaliphila]|uniref:Uncharacterized protein n=1 Tax=Phytoactinopolyspora alkaliphila TaxID=1783498 RepID=A0A6N9YL09_9ACTN|nr:hypothetical protein [Phytoactinopolyspora alkaliphila]NED95726.1 hypothetical protein [Phytoactinopolyspora alkaliphila]
MAKRHKQRPMAVVAALGVVVTGCTAQAELGELARPAITDVSTQPVWHSSLDPTTTGTRTRKPSPDRTTTAQPTTNPTPTPTGHVLDAEFRLRVVPATPSLFLT